MAMAAMTLAATTTRRTRIHCQRAFRERRCLSHPSAAGRVQLLLQSLVFTCQPLTCALRLLELLALAIDFSIEVRQ